MKLKLPHKINLPRVNVYWFVIVMLLSLTAFNFSLYLYSKNLPKKVLGVETSNEEVIQNLSFWQSFLAKNPEYFPGLVELAKIQIKQGDKEAYDQTISKIRTLGPNSPMLKYLDL